MLSTVLCHWRQCRLSRRIHIRIRAPSLIQPYTVPMQGTETAARSNAALLDSKHRLVPSTTRLAPMTFVVMGGAFHISKTCWMRVPLCPTMTGLCMKQQEATRYGSGMRCMHLMIWSAPWNLRNQFSRWKDPTPSSTLPYATQQCL